MTVVEQTLAVQLRDAAAVWARSQFELVTLAAAFADSTEWLGSPTPAHWLATVADVETSTAREWIRVGRCLRDLPASADAFGSGEISYAKVRALTRLATPGNETELLAIARVTPANDLGRALAGWLDRTSTPDEMEAHQRRCRSVTWRTEADGMTTFTLRLEPLAAGTLIAALTASVLRSPAHDEHGWPSLAQQYADAVPSVIAGAGPVVTEVVLHVRGDGATLDDGTPVPGTVVERIAPTSFVRALIHDADGRPINASGRNRHPTRRQQRVVKERDRTCVDCGSRVLLEFDHVPEFRESHRTVVDELQLRCAPCHHRRHSQP